MPPSDHTPTTSNDNSPHNHPPTQPSQPPPPPPPPQQHLLLLLQTEIIQASKSGNLPLLQSHPPSLLQTTRCPSGCTVLHWAAGCNHIPILEYLLTPQPPPSPPTAIFPNVNIAITARKGRGRTALHYAARNGALEAVRYLILTHNADVNTQAMHGVTPFQMAVWQNRLDVCRFLVEGTGGGGVAVEREVNAFGCSVWHWLGISPSSRADSPSEGGEEGGSALLPLAHFLTAHSSSALSPHTLQKQGHTALHKAAWGGHLALLRYLHTVHGMYDDVVDRAGNYAADLADMACSEQRRKGGGGGDDDGGRYGRCAVYLREVCGGEAKRSREVLGVGVGAAVEEVRRAFLERVRLVHPDRRKLKRLGDGVGGGGEEGEKEDKVGDLNLDFDAVREAYEHLTVRGGVSQQRNPFHSIDLMLTMEPHHHSPPPPSASSDEDWEEEGTNPPPNPSTNNSTITTEQKEGATNEEQQQNLFQTRLITVLLEFSDSGIDLCNIPQKWAKVWPDIPFDETTTADFMELRDQGGQVGSSGGGGKGGRRRRRKKGELLRYIMERAGDVVDIVRTADDGHDDDGGGGRVRKGGSIRVVPKCAGRRKEGGDVVGGVIR